MVIISHNSSHNFERFYPCYNIYKIKTQNCIFTIISNSQELISHEEAINKLL